MYAHVLDSIARRALLCAALSVGALTLSSDSTTHDDGAMQTGDSDVSHDIMAMLPSLGGTGAHQPRHSHGSSSALILDHASVSSVHTTPAAAATTAMTFAQAARQWAVQARTHLKVSKGTE